MSVTAERTSLVPRAMHVVGSGSASPPPSAGAYIAQLEQAPNPLEHRSGKANPAWNRPSNARRSRTN